MAKQALIRIGNTYQTVDAEDPNLSPHEEYYCNGICDGGKTCMCPVSLIEPDDEGDFVKHFRLTKKNVRHGAGCSHADESLFRYVDHLDHSGADMTDEDILRIGKKVRDSNRKQPGHTAGEGHTRADVQDGKTADDNRQYLQRQTKPRSIYQLYLVLSDPETKVYAGRKKAQLIVNNQTDFFHRNNPGDGVMLVVAERKFKDGPETPSGHACIVFQDTHFVPGQKQNRLVFVVEFENDDLYQKVNAACMSSKQNFKQKYLLLGDWHYDAATRAYYTTLTSWGHFKVLTADKDIEA